MHTFNGTHKLSLFRDIDINNVLPGILFMKNMYKIIINIKTMQTIIYDNSLYNITLYNIKTNVHNIYIKI